MKKKFVEFLLFHGAYEYFVYEFYRYRNNHVRVPGKTIDEYLSKMEAWRPEWFLRSAFSWAESSDDIYWAHLHNEWINAINQNNFPKFEFKTVTT